MGAYEAASTHISCTTAEPLAAGLRLGVPLQVAGSRQLRQPVRAANPTHVMYFVAIH